MFSESVPRFIERCVIYVFKIVYSKVVALEIHLGMGIKINPLVPNKVNDVDGINPPFMPAKTTRSVIQN